MYSSERIGVDIIIIIIIGIEAVLGLCGLTGFWAAHFSLGQYTLLLPVGLHSDTNIRMRVSLGLNMCCAVLTAVTAGGTGYEYYRTETH
jgi:hypothetical protein